MKKALKVTFGTMLAVSMAAPAAMAHTRSHHDELDHVAMWGDLTYMRTSGNGLSVGDYALVPPAGFPQNVFDGARNHYFLEPENEFDFAAGISYRFGHSSANRVFFSYDRTRNDNDRQGDQNVRNLGIIPTVGPFTPTFGTTEYDVHGDEYRLGLIHDAHLGDFFCLDLRAFLEYDRIRQNFNEFIVRDNNTDIRSRETENLVRGFGPGVGFNTRWYHPGYKHWHLFAGLNTSLLKLENEYSQTFVVAAGPGVILGQGYDYQPYETDSIVGKLDIEFGLNFGCAFRHEMEGLRWDVSLGMKYMNMFNVFKNGNTAWQPLDPNYFNGNGRYENFSPYLGAAQDWGKYGPFLRFKIGGSHS